MTQEQKQPEITDPNAEELASDDSAATSDANTQPIEQNVEEAILDNSEAETKAETEIEAETEAEAEAEAEGFSQEQEEIFAAFQQENANLKKMLDEKTQQSELTKAQYARLAADFENFRRRTAKEKESLEVLTKKNVITELLPVVDNFERARTQLKPESDGEKAIHTSYQGVYKTLVECLKKMGVSAMRPEGKEFDPNFHEAMLREPTDEYPEGTVIEQLMRGYVLGESILRHAMVKVAVPKEPVITSEEKKTEDQENNI